MERRSHIKLNTSAPSRCFVEEYETLVCNESLSLEDRTFSPIRSELSQTRSPTMKCHTPPSSIRKDLSREDFNVKEDELISVKRQVKLVMKENEHITPVFALTKQRSSQN